MGDLDAFLLPRGRGSPGGEIGSLGLSLGNHREMASWSMKPSRGEVGGDSLLLLGAGQRGGSLDLSGRGLLPLKCFLIVELLFI